ncbi:MAG: hypothetical protein SCALA702_14100 [Melioribacteraceae bacterium]|nr:MAG: hypothetical protein SCALA702_14100 [Melioribacteraceae bacterium]
MIKYSFILFILFAQICILAQEIEIPSRWFFVKSALEDGKGDRGYFDIPGHPKKLKDANGLELWSNPDDGRDRQFKFEKQSDGTYIIYCRAGRNTHVVAQENNKPGNGTDVRVINKKFGNHKKWRVKHLGDGRFKFYGKNNYVICADARKSGNGTNVHLWEDHEGPWMEWVLIERGGNKRRKFVPTVKAKQTEVSINEGKAKSGLFQLIPDKWFGVQTAMEKQVPNSYKGSWDVPGDPERVNGKADLWSWNLKGFKAPDVLFKFEKQSDGSYYIYSKMGYPNYVCQVAKSNSANGTSFEIAKKDGSAKQKFYVFTNLTGGIKVYSHDGYVVCLDGRSSENKSNIHMWEAHSGNWTEWSLIDPETGSKFTLKPAINLDHIKAKKTTGPNADKLLRDIDNAYAELFKSAGNISGLTSSAKKVNGVLNKFTSVSDRLSEMENKVANTRKALLAVKHLPLIGPAATPVTLTLKSTGATINKALTKVQSFEQPVIRPVSDKTNSLEDVSSLTNEYLGQIAEQLLLLKMQTVDKCNCIASTNNSAAKANFEKNATEVSKTVNKIAPALQTSNKLVADARKFSDTFKPIGNTIDKAVNSTNKFMNVFGKTEKAANKINDVLDKRFKKKYLKKTVINISLRDVLTAGGAFKKAKKWLKKLKIDIDKWARKALKPVTNQLGEKIPSVPNLDQYFGVVNSLKAKGDNIKDQLNLVKKFKDELENVRTGLQNDIINKVAGSDCNSGKTTKAASASGSKKKDKKKPEIKSVKDLENWLKKQKK